ncbi:CpsD/CapB family tyrosine-protein kinase [Bacillus sp. V59.32b]|uniref:CpsD/CapB family tyrosine-protein kinase n=1 Tax=Bacillus sp. V59.32b TaxID=1758642 RepID=UPI000E3DD511|nr:CpsD/CapB family tyrosine-protein kinase [Bacillus sp. V59.32b]RFU62728.1 polysaccharide biosynthesis tyrosine autokinase [Bacillus sp. V59.32b]
MNKTRTKNGEEEVKQVASRKKGSDNKRKLITKLNPKSPISEQYRTIRTNIQFSSVDKDIRSILVTSTAPAEGKSTTVTNLAVVFAQQGKKVLLVDADLRKPTVHFTFNLTNTFGLTNVLAKQASLKDTMVPTDEENLYVLVSGPVPPNPAELLGSKAMDDLIENILQEFDIVLFDSPPVLAVTDAQVLATRCDGTIFVVSSGKTEIEQAAKAKESLLSVNGTILGAILNNKKVKEDQYYYYHNVN